ncbi:hypothetical protein Bestia_00160 [Acinetobacter phage Bestia]|nr:hypothetical protein Bestia_00160 [Acinetobacter phage Bestia]
MKEPEIGTKVVIVNPDDHSRGEGVVEGDVAKVVGVETCIKDCDLLLLLHNPKWENMHEDVLSCNTPCHLVYLSECDIYEECLKET